MNSNNKFKDSPNRYNDNLTPNNNDENNVNKFPEQAKQLNKYKDVMNTNSELNEKNDALKMNG